MVFAKGAEARLQAVGGNLDGRCHIVDCWGPLGTHEWHNFEGAPERCLFGSGHGRLKAGL